MALSFVSRTDGFGIYLPQTESGLTIPAQIVKTTDGGSTWSTVAAAPSQIADADLPIGGGMVFLNRTTGFLYGSFGAYETHDGGRKWDPLVVPGRPQSVTTSGSRNVWLTFTTCKPPGATTLPCSVGIERSDDGGSTWQALPVPTSSYDGAQLAVTTTGTVFLGTWLPAAGTASGELLASHDGGRTWATHPLPCPLGYRLGGWLSVSAPTTWLICGGQGSGGTRGVVIYRSFNEGQTWVPESSYALGGPTGVPGGAPAGNLEAFVAISSRAAVALAINGGLMQSTDGGRTWERLGPVAMQVSTSGFLGTLDVLNATHMWVACTATMKKFGGLWRTVTGAHGWKPA